jgi:hypothetical protein
MLHATFSIPKMLADVNLDLVAAFLPDAKSMALFARASKRMKCVVYANIPAAIQMAKDDMTKYQRETLCNLSQSPAIGHLKAIVERKCIVCKKSYKGGIRDPWGIPAHPHCTKSLEVNVRYVDTGIPRELMSLVRSTIPVNVRDGYSSYHGQYTYETVIPKAIPGIIPANMTLAYFRTGHANEISAWMERVQREKTEKEEKRKRVAEEKRIVRQKKQKVDNEQRRTSIEGIVNTSYLKWMRTVPKSAKKYVSKLSAEDSVAVAGVIGNNADLCDEIHEMILAPGCTRPSATGLQEAYCLVREVGEEAVALFRRHHSVRGVRAAIVAREINQQRREAMAMVREDKYPLQQSGDTGRVCRCGQKAARDCVFNMCGGCCPKVTCDRHGGMFFM